MKLDSFLGGISHLGEWIGPILSLQLSGLVSVLNWLQLVLSEPVVEITREHALQLAVARNDFATLNSEKHPGEKKVTLNNILAKVKAVEKSNDFRLDLVPIGVDSLESTIQQHGRIYLFSETMDYAITC